MGSGSSFEISRPASTSPIGSHSAITSGVWWATPEDASSFHEKISTKNVS